MTTETMVTVDASLLAEMQSAMARQAAEIAALTERVAQPQGDAGTASVLAEYEAGLIQSGRMTRNLPGQKMVGPCLHEYKDGRVCRAAWQAHVPEMDSQRARIADHTYRETVLPHPDKAKPKNYYKRDDAPIAQVETPDEPFMSVAEAAKALTISVKECREMIAEGTLGVLKVGRTVIVKRQAVDRILALAAMQDEV